ncbi:MAG TPA: hypothetical protein VF162_02120 [Streptosporangiaceae bacterium]
MIRLIHFPAIQSKYILRGSSRWIALSASVAAVALGGCSSGGGSAGSQPSKALKDIKLAAESSQAVRTLTASLSVHSSGTSTGNLTGTIAIQLKPTKLIGARFHLVAGPSQLHLSEILTSDAIYFKDPSFAKSTGKPWVKASFSELSAKSGISLGSLLQNLEGSNPLDQTVLFTASKDVRVVGPRTVDGVATTEYTGTYSPEKAYKSLSPDLRKQLGTMLRNIGTHPVRFHVWIDWQHVIKKADNIESVRGQTVTTSLLVTSVNQPVTITLPKASQTAPLPKT